MTAEEYGYDTHTTGLNDGYGLSYIDNQDFMKNDSTNPSWMMKQAPFVQSKEYDHDDVDSEFTVGRTLSLIVNLMASIGAFVVFVFIIGVLIQFPQKWTTYSLLFIGGL